MRHLQEQHDARLVAAFRCRRCGYATTTLHAGKRHISRSCTGVRALEEAPQEVGPTELREDGTLVLQWPARPSSCPIEHCTFTTSASGVTVATSIDHHLARRHGKQMGRRLWRCTYCDKEMAGLETREHRCGGPRYTKLAGGPKLSRAGPPVTAPVRQEKSSLPNSKRQDGPRIYDGDDRRPVVTLQRRTARPEMPRPITAAQIGPPGGDEDEGTDEGEVHDEDSLLPSDWMPPPPPFSPRDELESAGEREDDMHASSLPRTSRP